MKKKLTILGFVLVAVTIGITLQSCESKAEKEAKIRAQIEAKQQSEKEAQEKEEQAREEQARKDEEERRAEEKQRLENEKKAYVGTWRIDGTYTIVLKNDGLANLSLDGVTAYGNWWMEQGLALMEFDYGQSREILYNLDWNCYSAHVLDGKNNRLWEDPKYYLRKDQTPRKSLSAVKVK